MVWENSHNNNKKKTDHRRVRCRHADFKADCPYPANTASPVTELDPRSNTICRLRPAPRPPSPSRIALHFAIFFVHIARYIRCPEAGRLSPTADSRRQLPSRAPHSFLSGSCTFTPFPHRTVYPLAECAFAVDTFHSSAAPVRALLSILRKSHTFRGEKIKPDSPCQISIFSSIDSVYGLRYARGVD
jgi:hypothetical protein